MTTRNRINAVLTVAGVAMAALAFATASANAQITFDGFTSWAVGSSTFDASVSDKLVVVVTGEHNFNQSANGQIYDVTYDGQSLTKAVDVDPKKISEGGHGDTATDIWYLDDPGLYHTSGTIAASVSGNGNNYVYTAIALSGTADGVGPTEAAPGASSVDLTTTLEDSMVIFNIGMGGGGNTASPLPGVTATSPAGAITFTGLEAGSNWAGHAVARAVIRSPGTRTFSFDTTKIDVATIAAAFEPGDPPRNLTLQVDIFTGETSILGDPTRDIDINYYQITSEGDSLDPANWYSLTDQDFEGGGPPSGTGDGWEEAGGAGPHALAEAYLLGSSTIEAAQSVGLEAAYDALVGAEDLAFAYRTDSGAVVEGLVEYLYPLAGDVDNDGDIDNADIGKAGGSFTGAGGSTSMTWHDGDMDGDGDVDNADLGVIGGAFTGAMAGGAPVPEPGMLSLLGLGGLALLRRRRDPSGTVA